MQIEPDSKYIVDLDKGLDMAKVRMCPVLRECGRPHSHVPPQPLR